MKDDPLLLNAPAVAKMLSITARHWHALNSRGACPAPVRLGRRVLWRREEVVAWIQHGCPSREKWLAMREGVAHD